MIRKLASIDLVFITLLCSSLLWFVLHIWDRRRIINGLFFFISFVSLYMLLLYLSINKDLQILKTILVLIFVLLLFTIPILFISVIILFLSTGKTLMEREGFSLAHGLSFLFGLGIIISIIIYPFIKAKIDSIFILTLMEVFIFIFNYFVLGFIIYYTASVIYKFAYYRKNKKYLIVLGAGLRKDGSVTPLLKGRIDKAIKFYKKQEEKTGISPILLMSGGQGKDEKISEALAMKNYALLKGIPKENIVLENQSKNTRENISFSYKIIKEKEEKIKDYEILFVTCNYHVFRTAIIGKQLDLKIHGLGSRVKLYYYISATIREYIAILEFYKGRNIIFCGILLSIFLLLK